MNNDVDKVTETAPERIWLEVDDDEDKSGEPFPADPSEDVTWSCSAFSVTTVEYVRADLVKT